MAASESRVPTVNGSKYLQQLCKHWSHKLEVEFTPEKGLVRFATSQATMIAEADALLVRVEAENAATLERMQGVVADHLDRFAFREAPLAFDWRPVAVSS